MGTLLGFDCERDVFCRSRTGNYPIDATIPLPGRRISSASKDRPECSFFLFSSSQDFQVYI